ncbi:hypothetical protein K402DRAFT_327383 [Aulographum hederae CBS 113979]|uniref:CREG-like beta-barrel domain-containing protein n=1 Tax=Aulographum hederae CBS 113979 TaxID=1176131 RepID=A0A6G1H7Q5_9PEZI|nr:hypothetical protein K402DRAFT_327383 [Aulographum hederae CBS 113979]
MRFSIIAVLLAGFSSASNLPSSQYLFSSEDAAANGFNIPTVHESAVMARRILRLSSIGTLSTVFPLSKTSENRPSSVDGAPLGLMDYFADCEPATGNPTFLAIAIASSFKNEKAGSNITLSMRWQTEYKHPYSPAEQPRFSLVGYMEDLQDEEAKVAGVPTCFLKKHPDAVAWLPGNRIHTSYWARLVVQEIYWIGGFGDRAYIGWIPRDEWESVTEQEIVECSLPGESSSWWQRWVGKVDL